MSDSNPPTIRDKMQINTCHVNGGEDDGVKFIESQVGVECEINTDRNN